MSRKLVVFDVDGTLVDSQGDIVAGLRHTFAAAGRPAPSRAQIVATIGMSLPETMRRLDPEASADQVAALVAGYKQAYTHLRHLAGSAHSSPLYPGARAALTQLQADPDVVLAVATGKSRRGLDILIEGHGLGAVFQSLHCADDHPSKPHPSMIRATLADTGVAAADAVMVGDTTFDRQMAAAADVRFVGVSWGYHPAAQLGPEVITQFSELAPRLAQMWGK